MCNFLAVFITYNDNVYMPYKAMVIIICYDLHFRSMYIDLLNDILKIRKYI